MFTWWIFGSLLESKRIGDGGIGSFTSKGWSPGPVEAQRTTLTVTHVDTEVNAIPQLPSRVSRVSREKNDSGEPRLE